MFHSSRVSAGFVCATAFAALCVPSVIAQMPATFNVVSSTPGRAPQAVQAVDVNNDGIPDLITVTGSTLPVTGVTVGYSVSLAKGDGTFAAPVSYAVNTGNGTPMEFTPVDLNNDGKVDLVFAVPGTTQLAVAMGNGGGTFQPVKYLNVALLNGELFAPGVAMIAADFNHDGKMDIAVMGVAPMPAVDPSYRGPEDRYILEGDGNGGFAAPRSVYSTAQNDVIMALATGDFDSDTNADLVLADETVGGQGPQFLGEAVYVLYGDGTGRFETHQLYSSSNANILALSTADLNGDGVTDILFIDGGSLNLVMNYGKAGKTFTTATAPMPQLPVVPDATLVEGNRFFVADFNDDGRNDLAIMAYTVGQVHDDEVLVGVAGSAPNTFTWETIQLPKYPEFGTPEPWDVLTDIVVGDFNNDSKPDIALAGYDVNIGSAGNDPSQIETLVNSTSGAVWSNCEYPMTGNGISVCAPAGSAQNPVSFNAAANSYGMLRKIELWVDGRKLAEQHNVWDKWGWLNASESLAAGRHEGTIYSADVDDRLARFDFAINVGPSGCEAPAEAGINICEPANESHVNSLATVEATARIPGTLARMELWVDGVKRYTEATSTSISTLVELRGGQHQLSVYAVNTAGQKWLKTVSVTAP